MQRKNVLFFVFLEGPRRVLALHRAHALMETIFVTFQGKTRVLEFSNPPTVDDLRRAFYLCTGLSADCITFVVDGKTMIQGTIPKGTFVHAFLRVSRGSFQTASCRAVLLSPDLLPLCLQHVCSLKSLASAARVNRMWKEATGKEIESWWRKERHGFVYAVGGLNFEGSLLGLQCVERFDPQSNEWTNVRVSLDVRSHCIRRISSGFL